jgi:serine/threonine protein kinase/tetratricopeptide (TPR) repeat protein
LIGEKISSYLIQEHLGTGGMAVVYRAVDQRLGRPVALKFLPPELKKQTEARQFLLREAQAASGLEHPNICTIYQIDETPEGQLFIAMAFYEGETLDARIKRGGPVPVTDAMAIAAQVAGGLAEAHRHGIVHCDIKPANLLLTKDGRVKILDFGIARLLEAPSSGRAKWIMGTVPYMSPEQIRGEEIDPRSDLWSLGVVLYQAVAGQRPFRGQSQEEIKKAILHSDPPAIPGYPETEIAGLQHILRWSLARRREDRYNNAREMQADLVTPKGSMPRGPSLIVEETEGSVSTFAQPRFEPRSSTAPTTGPQSRTAVPSIAVLLPLDVSRDRDQEHLCFGIAEELISRLARFDGLKVAARTSAFNSALGALDPTEIGGRLQVSTVLESSVRKFGDRLRISARLIETDSGAILWTEDYDREAADLFAVQDEIADKIATRLRGTLLGGTSGAGTTAREAAKVTSFEAFDLYLKGRYCWNKRTEDELRRGIDFFQKALQVSPDFPQAHAGLADSYTMLGIYGAEAPSDVMPRAKIAAERALELDPSLAEVYTSRGCVRSAFDWEFNGAAADFQRAMTLDPLYATAHQWMAMNCLIPKRRFELAKAELDKAANLDPMSLPINVSLGLFYLFSGDPAQAAQELQRVTEIDPDFPQAHLFLSQALREQGKLEAARDAAVRAAELSGGKPISTATLAAAHAALGDRKRVEWLLEKLLDPPKAPKAEAKAGPRARYVSPALVAQIYVVLGEFDLAFGLLVRSVRMRSADLLWLGVDPIYAPLRKFPRFQALLSEIGLEL